MWSKAKTLKHFARFHPRKTNWYRVIPDKKKTFIRLAQKSAHVQRLGFLNLITNLWNGEFQIHYITVVSRRVKFRKLFRTSLIRLLHVQNCQYCSNLIYKQKLTLKHNTLFVIGVIITKAIKYNVYVIVSSNFLLHIQEPCIDVERSFHE